MRGAPRRVPDAAVLGLWMLGIALGLGGLGLQTHRPGSPPPTGLARGAPAQLSAPARLPSGVSDPRLGVPQQAPAQLTTTRLVPSHTPGRVRTGLLATVVVLLGAGFWSKRRVLDL